MKKAYEEPIIEIRNYALPLSDVVMTSFINGDGSGGSEGGDLGDGNDFDYFG
ncbi:MAG: hypothetical protein J1E36_04570 [Eubacterium sp.]|nr:hypothetical protein [Eubacterium sp.]